VARQTSTAPGEFGKRPEMCLERGKQGPVGGQGRFMVEQGRVLERQGCKVVDRAGPGI
jgi:hypothetical protein